MITSEQVANIRRRFLGETIEVKVGNKTINEKWKDIQLDNKTGLIKGIYVGEKLYKLHKIDYIQVNGS